MSGKTMSSKKIWLVAEAPDGTGLILPHRTAAGYSCASIVQDSEDRWQLTNVWGHSLRSVESRTRTVLGHWNFRVVSLRPLEDAIPEVIGTYCKENFLNPRTGLVVRQLFYPRNGGWVSPPVWKRPSVAYLRQLKTEGAEAIGVGHNGNSGRVVDFQLDEILRPGRPLFGGSLIGSRVR